MGNDTRLKSHSLTADKLSPDGQVLLGYIKAEFLQFKTEFTELLNKKKRGNTVSDRKNCGVGG